MHGKLLGFGRMHENKIYFVFIFLKRENILNNLIFFFEIFLEFF